MTNRLFHTFGENPVNPCIDTDEVTDTPAHRTNSGTPPASTDTCPNRPGNDPVHNYMNYCHDQWMTEFTSEQVTRIQEHVAMYRPALLSSTIQAALKR